MRLYQQLKSLHGSLKGVAALVTARDGFEFPMSLEDLLAILSEALSPHHNRVTWHADVADRLKKLRLGEW